MKTVVITQGVYGYKPVGARFISPRDSKSAPFELPDDEAARIVELGIAEYVPDNIVATDIGGDIGLKPYEPIPSKESAENEPAQPVEAHLDFDGLMEMTRANLEKLAADMGIDITGAKNKADIANLITDAPVLVDGESIAEASEQPPELSAEDPVT